MAGRPASGEESRGADVRQFKAYVGRDSSLVTCINDCFGPSVAVFNQPYRPGDIARRNVGYKKFDYELTGTRFRIIREVSEEEIQKLLILAKCSTSPREGWWYEVIGD
jgi:hypothetical protein